MTNREKIAKLKEERTEKISLIEAEYNPQIAALIKTFTEQMLIDAGWEKGGYYPAAGSYAMEYQWVKRNGKRITEVRFSQRLGYVLTSTGFTRQICDEEDLEHYFKTGE